MTDIKINNLLEQIDITHILNEQLDKALENIIKIIDIYDNKQFINLIITNFNHNTLNRLLYKMSESKSIYLINFQLIIYARLNELSAIKNIIEQSGANEISLAIIETDNVEIINYLLNCKMDDEIKENTIKQSIEKACNNGINSILILTFYIHKFGKKYIPFMIDYIQKNHISSLGNFIEYINVILKE